MKFKDGPQAYWNTHKTPDKGIKHGTKTTKVRSF